MLKYDPAIHKIGHTYWEDCPKTTHRPVKFKYMVENRKIFVVKVDARRDLYMVNFGGCFSNVYIGSYATEQVSHRNLFLDRTKAQNFIDDLERRECFATMMHQL